jgi:hypothetical protein
LAALSTNQTRCATLNNHKKDSTQQWLRIAYKTHGIKFKSSFLPEPLAKWELSFHPKNFLEMDGENITAEATQPDCSSTPEAAAHVIKTESVSKIRRSQRILDQQIARASVTVEDTSAQSLQGKRKRSVTKKVVKRVRRDKKPCCSRSRSRSRRRRNMMAVFERMGREFSAMWMNSAREDAQEKDGDDSNTEASEEEDNLASTTVSTMVKTTRHVFTCPPSSSPSHSSQDSDLEQENEKRPSNDEASGDGSEKQPTGGAEREASSRSTSSSRSSSSDRHVSPFATFEVGSESVEAARERLRTATERLDVAMEWLAADSERLERMEVVDEEWGMRTWIEASCYITEHVLSLVLKFTK